MYDVIWTVINGKYHTSYAITSFYLSNHLRRMLIYKKRKFLAIFTYLHSYQTLLSCVLQIIIKTDFSYGEWFFFQYSPHVHMSSMHFIISIHHVMVVRHSMKVYFRQLSSFLLISSIVLQSNQDVYASPIIYFYWYLLKLAMLSTFSHLFIRKNYFV